MEDLGLRFKTKGWRLPTFCLFDLFILSIPSIPKKILLHYYITKGQQTTDNGLRRQPDLWNYGFTELRKLRLDNETLATPNYKTTSQRDNESGGSRLWLCGAAPDKRRKS